jgi:hypothetical protein
MGTSTVSGPFRSQNGFQELVNGVWTPVGSGGGGGGSVTVIPFTPGIPNQYELPLFTEVGQTAQFYWPFHANTGVESLELIAPVVPGTYGTFMVSVFVDYDGNYQNAQISSDVVADTDICNSLITVSYGGVFNAGGPLIAVYNLFVVNTVFGVG